MKIKELIKNKISEHEKAMNILLIDIDKLSKDIQNCKRIQDQDKKAKFLLLQLVVLKDRTLTHKASIETLKDLQNEIKDDE